MKRGGKGISVTVWSAIAVGAVGVGVILAFLAGYFLGHFTGHENTTTVALATAPSGGEIPRGEEKSEEPSEEASSGETESAPPPETTTTPAPTEGKGAEAAGKGAKPEAKPKGGGGEAGAGNPEAGQEVFATNCSICHGADGHGGGGGPDLRTMPKAKTEAGAVEQVTNGGGGMPPFKGTLSEEEIHDVAAYVAEDIVGGGS